MSSFFTNLFHLQNGIELQQSVQKRNEAASVCPFVVVICCCRISRRFAGNRSAGKKWISFIWAQSQYASEAIKQSADVQFQHMLKREQHGYTISSLKCRLMARIFVPLFAFLVFVLVRDGNDSNPTECTSEYARDRATQCENQKQVWFRLICTVCRWPQATVAGQRQQKKTNKCHWIAFILVSSFSFEERKENCWTREWNEWMALKWSWKAITFRSTNYEY